MKKITYLISVLLLFIGCSKSNNEEHIEVSYPECLNTTIKEILQYPVQNPKSTIKKYTYQKQTVYIVNFNFTDGQNLIYNDKCELICTIGGIGGSSQNTCINWNDAAFIETVWTDSR
jgi:hypothetical protein